jgi:hypothetical protein
VALDRALGVAVVYEEAHGPEGPAGRALAVPRGRGILDPDPEPRGHRDLGARGQTASGTKQGLPEVRATTADEEDLGLAPARACPQEACGKDAAAVENQEVPGGEEVGELVKAVVGQLATRTIEDEELRGGPVGERLLGDQLPRQRVVVGVDGEVAQNSFFCGRAAGVRSKCS